MAFPPTFTNVWDTTFPVDTELANLIGANLRQLRTDVMQRLSLLSGTLANRPTPETVNATWGGVGFGLLYFATDTAQIFQWSGSAWVDVSASILLSRRVAAISLTAQVAAIATSTLYSVPAGAAGIYRITTDTLITTAGNNVTVTTTIGWNNGVAALAAPDAGLNFVGAGGESRQTFSLYSAASQNITYSTALSGGVGTGVYALRLRVEYLG